ncbi:MAG: alanine--tRNA ligase [bacterium]
MTTEELRQAYIEFFKLNQHKQISGYSLIPENDPTVLFTTAGMHPLVPYLMGAEHPCGKRLCNWQKCVRTGDIDEVGDSQHLTFFEMLGNWSLGDYFKDQAIEMSYQFLTDSSCLGINPDKLFITLFQGDQVAPRDEQSAELWIKQGIDQGHIFFLGKKDNWWGPAGKTGPCGPDTEMFYDTGLAPCSANCQPGCPCGKYVEIWNDVFMEYDKQSDGSYAELSQKNVDTGMGLERTSATLNGYSSVYQIDKFQPIIEVIEKLSKRKFMENKEDTVSMRVIADHIRAAVFIMGDPLGVPPSNLDQGYIVRRLIRRAMRHAMQLEINDQLGDSLTDLIIELNPVYPELSERRNFILESFREEEQRFKKTLNRGLTELKKILPQVLQSKQKVISGRVAFKLYDTYGFPLEMTKELAKEHGVEVDQEGFTRAFEKHQEKSRSGSELRFKGGLADASEQTRKLHTATHLLHQALRMVLGEHVQQKGSNITPERLRFDFSHPQPMTKQEIEQVEKIVNEVIQKDLPISCDLMTLDEAKNKGAIALFVDKYSQQVKVYSVGDFSKEVCGGPHVDRTGELGRFSIIKEQSSSAGVRRIKAILSSE